MSQISDMRSLVLGSHNRKKCYELGILLEPLGLTILSLDQVGNPIEVEETGQTFIDNARLKAVQQAIHLGQWTVGEDSGLCLPGLGGEPGVFSARYSDPGATDERNNEKLLRELRLRSPLDRRAYYVSTIVLANPNGQILIEAEGRCWGRVIDTPRGQGGFGYDPHFEIPEYHRTFAEMGDAVKSVLSHRARSLQKFIRRLRELRASF